MPLADKALMVLMFFSGGFLMFVLNGYRQVNERILRNAMETELGLLRFYSRHNRFPTAPGMLKGHMTDLFNPVNGQWQMPLEFAQAQTMSAEERAGQIAVRIICKDHGPIPQVPSAYVITAYDRWGRMLKHRTSWPID